MSKCRLRDVWASVYRLNAHLPNQRGNVQPPILKSSLSNVLARPDFRRVDIQDETYQSDTLLPDRP